MADKKIPTLYEWGGGSEAWERLIQTFYDLTLKDEILRPFFEHMTQEHKHYVALWLIEVFGGPKVYTEIHGKLTSHPRMIRAHQTFDMPEAARVRWIQLMSQALDIEKLPDDPEFRAALMGYFEWGTRMRQVFQVTPVPENSPMPSWGWGDHPPYIP